MHNWAKNVRFQPTEIMTPQTTEDVIAIINEARRTGSVVRVLGARHSFSPLIVSPNIIVDPSRMHGLIRVNAAEKTATFWAGTPISAVGPLLQAHGLALANQGDIDSQTLAGAISTGTHGTGINYGSLSSMVTAIEFVDGEGNVQTLDRQSPADQLAAAQVALGTFGVLTKITMQCEPSFFLTDNRTRADLDKCLADLPAAIKAHRHYEFFWFPGSSLVQIKTLDDSEERRPRSRLSRIVGDEIVEKALYRSMCEVTALFPQLSLATSRLCGRLIPDTNYADYAHRVYPSSREVRFTEMEYAVPLESGPACFEEIRQMIARERIQVFFPVEFRVAAADTAWISAFHGRQSAVISLHVYKNIDEERYFGAAEPIFKSFGGRPHWGKIHSLDRRELATMYPRWLDFIKARATFDPQGIFLNPMLQRYVEC